MKPAAPTIISDSADKAGLAQRARSRLSSHAAAMGHEGHLVRWTYANMEAQMTGILGMLHVDHGVHGARVMARSLQLTSDCNNDDEIDTAIQMHKDDLDACAREMKRLLEVNRRGSLFEGWLSARDDLQDA
jgi:hypothetical protein